MSSSNNQTRARTSEWVHQTQETRATSTLSATATTFTPRTAPEHVQPGDNISDAETAVATDPSAISPVLSFSSAAHSSYQRLPTTSPRNIRYATRPEPPRLDEAARIAVMEQQVQSRDARITELTRQLQSNANMFTDQVMRQHIDEEVARERAKDKPLKDLLNRQMAEARARIGTLESQNIQLTNRIDEINGRNLLLAKENRALQEQLEIARAAPRDHGSKPDFGPIGGHLRRR